MSYELNPIRQALHDARIQRLCEGLQDTRIDWKNLEIERLKQALHDARIENSGQAAELERLNEARRWISVQEQLPPVNTAVLTRWRGETFSVDWRFPSGEWTTGAFVTHWMPLPPPPKEVQG
jgi:hypothetical protein